MTDVLVLTAVEYEARRLARQLELPRVAHMPFPVYERPAGAVRLRLAPVGLRAARLAERWSALHAGLAAPLVVSAGTCGGLAPDLEAGDLILPESVLGPAGERWNVTPSAHAECVRLASHARLGLLVTSRDVLATPEAKGDLWRSTGALAVDLESALVLAWSARQGCPSLVVRAIADTASQRLPAELVGLVTAEGKLLTGRVLALAFTRPTAIPSALLLRRGSGRALRSVARLIAALVG